jgi:hypothetical protein
MKSLSPNAQEFVPFKTINSNSNVPLVQMTNDLNQQQIIHGYIPQQPQQQQQQQQFISYPNYEQSAVQGQTVYAFNNLNDFNNYMLKPAQQQQQHQQQQQQIRFVQPIQTLQVHSVSPTIQNHEIIEHQPQIPHHHMQASLIPINSSTPAYYAFTPQQQQQPTPPPPPPPVPVPASINYIDSNNMIINQFHDNNPKRSFNNANVKILNNNNKKLNNKLKTNNNIEVNNDKEWPSLVPVTNENQQKKKSKDKKQEQDLDESNDMTQPECELLPKTPYLEDETKLKKLIKNVDFIKKTVEQHYNNLNEGKFSFKDAVLAKPVSLATSNKQTISTKESVSDLDKKKEQPKLPLPELVTDSNVEVKKHRKRSRNKKKQLEKQDTLTDNEQKVFDLKNEDFPDLATNENKTKQNKLSLSLDLDAKPTTIATNVVKSEKKSIEIVSGKKQSKPIIVDFANMISALEVIKLKIYF